MLRIFIIVIFAFFVLSCSEPGEATKVGAISGGAVGAGLGAIIGSQTGDAGGGIAIGALAGAGTGAAVGNAFDGRDAAMRTQDEAIARQEQIIKTQKSEIQELREMTQESISYNRSDFGPRARFKSPKQDSKNNTNNTRANTAPNSLAPNSLAQNSPAHLAKRVPATDLRLPAHLQGSRKEAAVKGERNKVPVRRNTFEHTPPAVVSLDAGETEDLHPHDRVKPSFYESSRSDYGENIKSAELEVSENKREEPIRLEQEGTQELYRMEGNQEVASFKDEVALNRECEAATKEIQLAGAAAELADKLFHYRRALRLCPENPNYHSGLGDLYLSLNRSEDARFEFQEALKLDPGNSVALAGMQSLASASVSIEAQERY